MAKNILDEILDIRRLAISIATNYLPVSTSEKEAMTPVDNLIKTADKIENYIRYGIGGNDGKQNQ